MAIAIMEGDCIESLKALPDESVHCCVTSPPYFGLRSYLPPGHPDKGLEIGLEATPAAYVERMVEVFREVRRVLHPMGTIWLNVGDSYCSSHTCTPHSAIKKKDLLMVPARLAMALQADGWYLRSEVVWQKPNCLPESVTDRPGNDSERVYLLAKSERYFYDAEGVKVPSADGDGTRNLRSTWSISTQPFRGQHFAAMPQRLAEICIAAGTSERGSCPCCGTPWRRVFERSNVVAFTHRGSPFGTGKTAQRTGGHRAQDGDRYLSTAVGWQQSCSCPTHEPVPCAILDPFGGAATTGLVAGRMGRHAVLCELNPEYVRLAERRLRDELLDAADIEILRTKLEAA